MTKNPPHISILETIHYIFPETEDIELNHHQPDSPYSVIVVTKWIRRPVVWISLILPIETITNYIFQFQEKSDALWLCD